MRRTAILPPLADLDAIPERLFDTLFRSRLEARWAIWLTEMGVEWEYEPAPIRLNGRHRWPDFWAKSLEVWLEVKPAHTPVDTAMAAACSEETGCALLWLAGPPRFGDYTVSLCDFGGLDTASGLVFALTRRGHDLWLASPDLSTVLPLPPREWLLGEDVPRVRCHALTAAYRAAMTWQFEEETS